LNSRSLELPKRITGPSPMTSVMELNRLNSKFTMTVLSVLSSLSLKATMEPFSHMGRQDVVKVTQ
jgi:hypothetical protein